MIEINLMILYYNFLHLYIILNIEYSNVKFDKVMVDESRDPSSVSLLFTIVVILLPIQLSIYHLRENIYYIFVHIALL